MSVPRMCGAFSFPVVVILGSTGTGKSKLGIELAEKLNGEIISADSMQVYKGLDIITNKVTEDEQKRCKHHMIDLVSPLESFNVVEFRNIALPLIIELAESGKLPIIVGGTNYYIEALLWDILINNDSRTEDVDKIPKDSRRTETRSDAVGFDITAKRACSVAQADDLSTCSLPKENSLYEELKRVDPVMASKLHPNNARKIARSLEVFKESGKRHSDMLDAQKTQKSADFLGGPLRFKNTLVFWLTCDTEILNKRLSGRVDDMIKRGLLDEIREFYDTYAKAKLQDGMKTDFYKEGIFQSIGFKEFHGYLSTTEKDETERKLMFENCVTKLKQVTIKYAKKQIAWVKNRFLGRPSCSAPDVYKLSTNNPSHWDDEVLKPALEIVKSFFEGNETQYKPMPRVEKLNALDRHKHHTCELCNGRVIIGDQAWDSHCRSRGHRKLRAKRRKLEVEETAQSYNVDK